METAREFGSKFCSLNPPTGFFFLGGTLNPFYALRFRTEVSNSYDSDCGASYGLDDPHPDPAHGMALLAMAAASAVLARPGHKL